VDTQFAIFSKGNSRRKDGSIKRLAARQTVVVVPVVVEPVPVQAPAVIVPVEVCDVEVAVGPAQQIMRRIIRVTTP